MVIKEVNLETVCVLPVSFRRIHCRRWHLQENQMLESHD